MTKDTPKKKKWRFQFANRGKAKQYYTGEGDTPKQGWQSAMRKMVAQHGHMVLPHAHSPLGWEEIKEWEEVPYKNLAHTIRDMNTEVLMEDVIAYLKGKGYADVQKNGSGISTIHPEAVTNELEELKKKGKIKKVPPVYPVRHRVAASELEEGLMKSLDEGLMDPKPCPCGSGKSSWWESDAKSIPLARVCEDCFAIKMKQYRQEVLTNPSYKQTEDDDEPKDGDLAPWERGLNYESTDYLEERRKGPTKPYVRERQRVGARRAQAMKSTKPHKIKKGKDGRISFLEQYLESKKKLIEAVASDQGPEKTIVKTETDEKNGTSKTVTTHRAQRRRIIKTTGNSILARFRGWHPYPMWDGSAFGN